MEKSVRRTGGTLPAGMAACQALRVSDTFGSGRRDHLFCSGDDETLLDPAPLGKVRAQIMKLEGTVRRRIVPYE